MINIVSAGKPGILINNTEQNINTLSDEVVNYVSGYVELEHLTEDFWNDFLLGISLYGISVGYVSDK